MMKFFSRKRRRIRFNRAKYEREVDRISKESAEKAAKIWLDNALSKIPVWSGASHATFEALASSIGYPINISSVQDAPNRIALGRLNSGGGIERRARGNWVFTYRTNLRYLLANDKQSVSVGEHGVIWGLVEPTPYNFSESGQKAVEEFARTVRLPEPPVK